MLGWEKFKKTIILWSLTPDNFWVTNMEKTKVEKHFDEIAKNYDLGIDF